MAELTLLEDKHFNVHQNHRIRVKDKFLAKGLNGFLDHEILEFILFYSLPQVDTNPIAHALINRYKTLMGVFNADINDLMSMNGVGQHSAILIKLIPALARLINNRKDENLKYINNQKESKIFVETLMYGVKTEEFYVICLDDNNGVINTHKESSGEFSKVEVQIRKITDHILKSRCTRIIIAHNHPYSYAEPSDEDLVMTHKLYSSCLLNDIEILDHIIYSPYGSYSFAESGALKNIKNDILGVLCYSDSKRVKNFRTNTKPYIIV